jgi:TRAP-type C4-dicarboxylate transport system permease small subunit
MKSLERLAALLFGLAFLGLALAVAIETILRKVFNTSLQGVDELGGYVLAVGAGLSFAIALLSRAHIRIDIVHDHLPRNLRVLMNILAIPALAACAVSVLVMGWIALQDTISYNATAQTPWATPLRYPQTLWVIALATFALFAVVEALGLFRLIATGRFDEIDQRYGPRGTKDEVADELADIKARGVVISDAQLIPTASANTATKSEQAS